MIKAVLIAIAVAALSAVYLPLITVPHSEADSAPLSEEIHKDVVSGKPDRISVPRLGMDLAVVDGLYQPADKSWTLGKKTAQFATTTALPNDASGNTFIYGHNNRYVFGNLLNIQSGDDVIITDTDGKRFHYNYKTSFDVKPHQVESVAYSDGPTLTIQTCVGQYFEQRRMFVFDFVKVET